jgi:uncharacterized protein
VAIPDRPASLREPLLVAVLTTLAVTALSYALPEQHAATGVGLVFLAVTYRFALRREDPRAARRYGLSLGGLMDPEPLDARRLLADGLSALGHAAILCALVLPLFWLGYVLWWQPERPFSPPLLSGMLDETLGWLLVIALPEEAFYRGYLQTALDDAKPPRVRVLGAPVGVGILLTSTLFAIGHVLTEVHPNRLAVFFPSLLFGWLRARTGGIGASIAFHAACNLFASYLARGYGFAA